VEGGVAGGGFRECQTVRHHLQEVGERLEEELGEERELHPFDGTEEEWAPQPLPDGPITVGMDGGSVRGAHKQGCFEVIAGRTVVAFRRAMTGSRGGGCGK
jgi:hypothetical protein